MKNGTMYASRLKKAYASQRAHASKPDIPETEDPITCLARSILGVDCSAAEANRRVQHLLSTAVDWNEVRVSLPVEICLASGQSASDGGMDRSQRLIQALRAIYQKEHRVSLDRLKNMGRREARQYLEQLEGVDEFAAASVILWSFGGHAIPVNDPLHAALRDAGLVNPEANRSQVQAFLERHISAAHAKEFCLIMQSFKGKTSGGRSAGGASARKKTSKKKAGA